MDISMLNNRIVVFFIVLSLESLKVRVFPID